MITQTTTFQDSTVLSLPNEITTLIFQWACINTVVPNVDALDAVVSSLTDEPAEIIVSHVCFTWRSVALASSGLWSQYTYRNNKVHRHELDRLAVYLVRSRNQSLDLSFMLSDDPGLLLNPRDPMAHKAQKVRKVIESQKRAFSLFHIATEHAHRWRRISLEVQELYDFLGPDQNILRPLQVLSFPNLELFEIYAPRLTSTGLDPIFWSDNKGDTSPRIFKQGATPKLSCVRVDPSAFAKFMPSLNITTLELHLKDGCPYSTDLYPITGLIELLSSPTLINLSVIGEIFDSPEVDFLHEAKPLTSNLKNFRCSDSTVVGLIWNCFCFPQLETIIFRALTIGGLWQYPHDNNRDIFPALRTLALVNCESPSLESLVPISQLIKNLTHLLVVQDSDYMEYDPFDLGERSCFSRLVEGSPNIILWPNLDILTVSRPIDYVPSLEQVASYVNIVKCRTKHCTLRLPQYNAECWKSVNPESWEASRAAGLVQEFPSKVGKSVAEWMPWPSRELQGFRHGSEDPFFASRSGGEEEM